MWTTLRTRLFLAVAVSLLVGAACNLHEDLEPIGSTSTSNDTGAAVEDAASGGDGLDASGGGVDTGRSRDTGGPAPDGGDTRADVGCQAPDDATFCAGYGKNCGSFTGVDVCGETRTADCGACTGGDVCGSGTPNVCGCPCEIDGACRPAGAANPLDPCQICDPEQDTTGWSIAAGASCEDGDLCTTGETCDAAGVCGGGVDVECSGLDGACVAGACNPTTGQCTTTPANEGMGCPVGLSCATGVCDTGLCDVVPNIGSCVIGGVCYEHGVANPQNPCEVCDAAASPTAWSAAPAGTTCGDTSPSCVAGGQCAGTTCEISLVAGTCRIQNTCYSQNQQNPASSCQICSPSISQTTWTNRPEGTACGSMANCGCEAGACLKPNGSTCS